MRYLTLALGLSSALLFCRWLWRSWRDTSAPVQFVSTDWRDEDERRRSAVGWEGVGFTGQFKR